MSENEPGPMGGKDGGGLPVDLGGAAPVPPVPPAAPAPAAPPPAAPVPPVAPAKATPAAEPTPPTAKTIADTPPPGEEPKPPTPANWPENWRELMAGDDKKELARLQRFNSPLDVRNSHRALEQRLSSGEFKRALPTNHTPEELAEFRKSNGIPEKPDGYDVNVGGGYVWGEADKPFLENFTAFAHERNMPADTVKSALEWFATTQQREADAIAERDQRELALGSEALRAEWGRDYKPNLTSVRNMFEGKTATAPDGAQVPMFDLLMAARAPDGRLLGNIPDVLKWVSGVSRELNPFATLVPDEAGGGKKTAQDRFDYLSGLQRDRQSSYYYGPQRDALQTEWRELYEKLEAAKGRAA